MKRYDPKGVVKDGTALGYSRETLCMVVNYGLEHCNFD